MKDSDACLQRASLSFADILNVQQNSALNQKQNKKIRAGDSIKNVCRTYSGMKMADWTYQQWQ